MLMINMFFGRFLASKGHNGSCIWNFGAGEALLAAGVGAALLQ